jgi:hypothetical protein
MRHAHGDGKRVICGGLSAPDIVRKRRTLIESPVGKLDGGTAAWGRTPLIGLFCRKLRLVAVGAADLGCSISLQGSASMGSAVGAREAFLKVEANGDQALAVEIAIPEECDARVIGMRPGDAQCLACYARAGCLSLLQTTLLKLGGAILAGRHLRSSGLPARVGRESAGRT